MKASFKLALKGSALGAMVFLSAAAGCSDSTSDTPAGGGTGGGSAGSSSKAGNTSKSGSSNGTAGDDNSGTSGSPTTGSGGAAGEGGATSTGGVSETGTGGHSDLPIGFGGDSSAGGAGTGPAVAKFCNTLTFGNADTTMILTVGEGGDKVTFTASTGECVPADGDACTEIPLGADVLVEMADADAPDVALDSGTATIQAGQDWIFYTDIDVDQPIWNGGPLTKGSGVACEDIVYADIP